MDCSIFLLMRLAREYSPLDCCICLYRNVPAPLLCVLSGLCGLFFNATAKRAESTKSLKRKSLSSAPSPLLCVLGGLCGLFFNVTAKHTESIKSLKRKSLSSAPSPLLCVLSGLCGLFLNVTAKRAENAEGFISMFWFCV